MLLAGTVLTPGGGRTEGWVAVEGGTVAEIGSGQPAGRTRRYGEVLGGEGFVVGPGFVDLQVNGYAGQDAADGADAIAEIARRLPATGVTGFLPTVISGPFPAMLAACEAARVQVEGGARVLGIHLEGPFLNPEKNGAHDRSFLVCPDADAVRAMIAERPRLVTIAPELPGAMDAIAALVEAGVVVSVGHSTATFDTARRAYAKGARFTTHLFNAMSPWRHREPGVPGAALATDGVVAGLIADGVHIHPAMLDAVVKLRAPQGLALTTDMVAAAGAPPGRYRLGTLDVISDGRRVTLEDGTLAGASATMDELVRVVAGLPSGGLDVAVEMAAQTPARVLGEDRMGRIEVGGAADLVLLDDELRVRLTMVGGEEVYRA